MSTVKVIIIVMSSAAIGLQLPQRAIQKTTFTYQVWSVGMLLPRARSGKKQKITVITLARQLGLSGTLFFITPILTKKE
jgi:hypothetical protein